MTRDPGAGLVGSTVARQSWGSSDFFPGWQSWLVAPTGPYRLVRPAKKFRSEEQSPCRFLDPLRQEGLRVEC
jgi:hypothetical protein